MIEGSEAFKNTDGLNFDDTEIRVIDDEGFPIKKINASALENDIRAFWLMHEKKLYLIWVVCGLILLSLIW